MHPNPAILATVAINFSLVVGVLCGWYLRGLKPCWRNHGPFIRVPDGASAHLKLTGACELGSNFAEVSATGQLLIVVSGETKMGPGEHDLHGVTFHGPQP